MGSVTSIMNTGIRSMFAAQAALDTTAQNIPDLQPIGDNGLRVRGTGCRGDHQRRDRDRHRTGFDREFRTTQHRRVGPSGDALRSRVERSRECPGERQDHYRIAEKLDRLLDAATDEVGKGLLANQIESLGDQIDQKQDEIDIFNQRLVVKRGV